MKIVILDGYTLNPGDIRRIYIESGRLVMGTFEGIG